MKVKIDCADCLGTGRIMNNDPYQSAEVDCERCDGVGHTVNKIIGDELTDILNYCAWIKEKLETMS